jgi:ferritin-like protein
MSRASLELLRGGTDAAEVAGELDRLYCYEQVVVHWCKAVENRVSGFAAFVLPDELAEVAGQASTVATRLAARIAQLGGEITADPSEFVERAPIDRFALPQDFADPIGILTIAIGYERSAITSYDQLAERLRADDAVTHRLLTKILAAKLAREDEIESVLPPATTESAGSSAVAPGRPGG